SNSYVNLKIATCLVRYADDRLIDQRFLRAAAAVRRADIAGRMPARSDPQCLFTFLQHSAS
ncbi:hypothetical protein, partial [Burkholderia cenocepacia]|uniref:hypothetical protein n=1 Tax=Burkholderia cenocepacia TaxID=95486 RepID=UPI001C4DE95E